MNQQGGTDKTELTPEEVEAKKKLAGLFPEIGLLDNGVDFELLGIETKNDEKYYVIEYRSGETTTKSYYHVDSYTKKYTETLTVTEEGPQATSATFSEFEAHNKILFPHKTVQMIESAGMTATVKEININVKIDDEKFKL